MPHNGSVSYLLLNKEVRCTVPGHVKMIHDSQHFYYMACSNCCKQTSAADSQEYIYHHCGKKQVAKPRAKYAVLIYNYLTQLEVVAFGDVAESIVGLTAAQIINRKKLDKSINNGLKNKKFLLQVRKKCSDSSNADTYYYNLLAAIAFVEEPAYPVSNPTAKVR